MSTITDSRPIPTVPANADILKIDRQVFVRTVDGDGWCDGLRWFAWETLVRMSRRRGVPMEILGPTGAAE